MLLLSQGLLSRIIGTLLTSSPPWDPPHNFTITLEVNSLSRKGKGVFLYGEPFYLIEAVLGQLKTTLISPKNLPSPIVSNTIGSSCSETTSTVPR